MPGPLLRFEPLLKRILWGGRRLGDVLKKPIGDHVDYAESWEIVDHGTDQSVVREGVHAGRALGDLFHDEREWLMGQSWCASHPAADRFPLLLKYLDCNRVLSVQVHPNDEQGAHLDPPDLGKTEAWYVVHAEPESVIYAGLKEGINRDRLAECVAAGTTEDALHSFRPSAGDCVFIPAGTVHALGGGLLIAELQQSSDTTFRLFDWNRVGADGQPRQLHIEESLAVTDFERGPVDPVKPSADGGLVACDKFELQLHDESDASRFTIGGDGRCHVLTMVGGSAQLIDAEGATTDVCTGESVLLPAASGVIQVTLSEGGQLLHGVPV
ncbi:MAG: type I phosphomannose isomerase catalytic subunit [Planctomycetota bacterium]